ncbi:Two pore potassium channel protein sup-9 [Orchesella cincta]|uniref:Two pore potassium channel protein sup-9 n=1 Tax=Orchesella cincta TaxID=48709 RepID=A0A1D2NHZ0_ORCCI|nr:Two pore potassium channel protein sup-9 [Orchesella cincta]
MKRQNVRTLSLVVTTFTYLLVGAAVFDSLESSTEEKRVFALNEIRDDLKVKYNITNEDYQWIEQMVIENTPHKAGPQWKFAGAFYFATVVLAMIGYGHSTPSTIGGKAFCMLYAAIGIPLGIVMFQSIGERLNKGASIVISNMKKLLKFKKAEATEINLMMATTVLSSIIMTTGAAVFSKYEGWTYFDAFYYCFITLTTIGFGDYVALQNDHALQEKPGYMALSVVFILFGLAVVASSINILVLRFMTMQAEEMQREDTELGPVSQNVITLDGEIITPDGRLLQQSEANLCHSSPDRVSVCSCTCYPRYNDLHSVYKRSRSSRIYKYDTSGTEEELYSADEVPAILEKRASV